MHRNKSDQRLGIYTVKECELANVGSGMDRVKEGKGNKGKRDIFEDCAKGKR